MGMALRLSLVIGSFLTMYFIIRKIKKSQLHIESAIFWVFFSAALLLMSLFPSVLIYFAKVLDIQSPVNFVFLMIIFIIIVKLLSTSIKLSKLEEKVKILTQEIAIEKQANYRGEEHLNQLEVKKGCLETSHFTSSLR